MGHDLRPDIQAAKDRMSTKLGAGRELKKLEEHVGSDEQVRAITSGTYDTGKGVVVLTDRRLLFLREGHLSKSTEDFPLSKVSSISWSSGMLMGTIKILTAGATSEIKNVHKGDGQAIVDMAREDLGAAEVGVSPAAAPAPADHHAALVKLAELRDAGILTPEEFESKKSEILARM